MSIIWLMYSLFDFKSTPPNLTDSDSRTCFFVKVIRSADVKILRISAKICSSVGKFEDILGDCKAEVRFCIAAECENILTRLLGEIAALGIDFSDESNTNGAALVDSVTADDTDPTSQF